MMCYKDNILKLCKVLYMEILVLFLHGELNTLSQLSVLWSAFTLLSALKQKSMSWWVTKCEFKVSMKVFFFPLLSSAINFLMNEKDFILF